MNNIPSTLIPIIIIIVLICFIIKKEGFNTVLKKCDYNNKKYEVQDSYYNKKIVNLIGKIDITIDKFVNYLLKSYNNPNSKWYKNIRRLEKNLFNTKFKESPFEKNTSSYTINKGEVISICLRQKNKNKTIHDFNTLMFVVIHELAHVMSIKEGHTTEWMDNFRFLLKEGEKAEIYTPINYSINNMNYCGVDVTHNPYYNSI